jgi:formate dehydrogenase subunit gamma
MFFKNPLLKKLGLSFILSLLLVLNFNITSFSQTSGEVPGSSLGFKSDADLWRYIREGNKGNTQLKNEMSAVMIQSEGDNWRSIRNGPMSRYGAYGLIGIIILLAWFYSYRGRIKVSKGFSGDKILRFKAIERFSHWLMAGSFIVLALTGLNMLYGRYVLLPVVGPETFSQVTSAGKYAHNYIAFAFMVGLVMSFICWVTHNIPSKLDIEWLQKGGGLFDEKAHPQAKKFNAGQKIIFWAVMLGGLSISLSGWALLFPYETHMMSKTYALLNMVGFNLSTDLTPLQEQQLQQIWHGIVGLVLIILIIAHIYIGSLGMQGAFDAMNTGEVDRNWAKEHHGLWVEEEDQKAKNTDKKGSVKQPAE